MTLERGLDQPLSRHAMKPSALAIERELRAMYGEMPGLALTVAQASRLLNADSQVVRLALQVLVGERFLRLNSDRYALVD
jgi:hypothetical protein